VSQTLGEVGLFADSLAPTISRVECRQLRSGNTHVSFRFADDFSGIEYRELKAYIDGELCIPEIDGEHHRATYETTTPLSPGSHLLKILVRDKLGNTTEIERQFTTR
jgi:hypothetical protein